MRGPGAEFNRPGPSRHFQRLEIKQDEPPPPPCDDTLIPEAVSEVETPATVALK
jgi:hypothetical protein